MEFHVLYFPTLTNFYDCLAFSRGKVDGKYILEEF